ncbi:MAG: transposase [Lewinellaceae bacterium]|nr:transposase [Lewinellaceae bacterium]MCB9322095.1 transposase [Lewinellaceae bacterium]
MNKGVKQRKTIRYSESFKMEVIRRMETEGLSATGVAKKYEIKGTNTVKKWLVRYGKNHLLSKQVLVMDIKEQDVVKRLKQENEELRKLVVNLQLESLANESYLEIACEQLGVDKESLKKKRDQK